MVECSVAEACPSFSSSEAYFNSGKCAEGYQGSVCRNCIFEYSKNAFDQCVPCNFRTHIIFFIKFLVACGFMLLDNMNLLDIGRASTLEKERRPLMKLLVFHLGNICAWEKCLYKLPKVLIFICFTKKGVWKIKKKLFSKNF